MSNSEQPATHPPDGRFQHISNELLRYDSKNPRTVEILGDKPTQEQVEELLLGEMRARELIPSFMENGYIPYEPLIVSPDASVFVVVEGNRRLAAIRSMRRSDDPDEVDAYKRHGLTNVPCLIFDGSRREKLAYLGLRHLSKTKDWSTSAKGRFVERILESGHDLKQAARITNTTTNSLRLILLTRRLFEEASNLGMELAASGAEGDTIFWHLGDAIRRTRTKNYLALQENPDPLLSPEYDQTRLEFLIGWLYGSRKHRQQRIIGSIRDIGSLDKCLGDKRSIEALEAGASLAEAEEELEAAGAKVSAHLDRAKRSVQRASGALSDVIDHEGMSQVELSSGDLERAHHTFLDSLESHRKRLPEDSSEM